MRGVGGIFFDHLTERVATKSALFSFVRDVGFSLTSLYAPFLTHRTRPYTTAQRDFQLHRRSRYVEFNLLWDRFAFLLLPSSITTIIIIIIILFLFIRTHTHSLFVPLMRVYFVDLS
jgi:coproporphyrinogen III oxidase